MSVYFFESTCREDARKDGSFGICDDQDGSKAYTNTSDKITWIAEVVNTDSLSIVFTAIDNCLELFKEGTKDKESTCDGMLEFLDSIYLVELKEQATGGWLPKAKRQLENTIELLNVNDSSKKFKHKKAYACNKKHPNFTVIDVAERKSFFEKTGYRIDAQAKIVIKAY